MRCSVILLQGVLTKRGTHFLAYVVDEASVIHVVHQIQQNFDRGKDHGRVCVLHLDDDSLGKYFGVLRIVRNEPQ